MTPKISVMPSSAFTLNVSGNLYPAENRELKSAVSKSINFFPSAEYNADAGVALTRDELLTK